MKRLLAGLQVLIGLVVAGCEEQQRERPDVRVSNGQPQVEVTVQQ